MPVSLFYGDNTLEIDEAVTAARRNFAGTDALVLDSDVALPDLAEACLTAGLFEPERLVIARDLHERFKKSGEAEEIEKLIEGIPPTTTLILVSPELKADHRLAKAVKAAGGTVRAFEAPKRRDLGRWIGQRARQKGITIDGDAAELLAELVGSNPQLLMVDLEKVATYAGDGHVTVPMVEELVGAVTQDSIFTLVDAIAAGDRASALRLLHAQLERGTGTPTDFALYLIRMLTRQMRILLRLRLGLRAGRSTSQMVGELKLPRYYADRYVRQSRRLPEERLRASFEQLAGLEHAIKSGKGDVETGLDLLVTELCA